jgi:hypothetical protein
MKKVSTATHIQLNEYSFSYKQFLTQKNAKLHSLFNLKGSSKYFSHLKFASRSFANSNALLLHTHTHTHFINDSDTSLAFKKPFFVTQTAYKFTCFPGTWKQP